MQESREMQRGKGRFGSTGVGVNKEEGPERKVQRMISPLDLGGSLLRNHEQWRVKVRDGCYEGYT